MSIRDYNEWKHKYENTKPIRGRTEDVRPIGERRRDWERVVQDGDKYGARLYDTNCVMLYPNGDVELQINTWATPSTAQFIQAHSPWGIDCFKRYNALWVSLERVGGGTYPLPTKGVFRLKFLDGKYVPAETPKLQQRVVDRTKSRDVRKQVEPFRNYCKNMLKLADGWLRRDLVAQFEVKDKGDYWRRSDAVFRGKTFTQWDVGGSLSEDRAQELYEYMCNATEDEYPNLLVLIAMGLGHINRNLVETKEVEIENGRKYTREIYEFQYRPQSIVTRIEAICKKANDVMKVVEVESGKVITNVV